MKQVDKGISVAAGRRYEKEAIVGIARLTEIADIVLVSIHGIIGGEIAKKHYNMKG